MVLTKITRVPTDLIPMPQAQGYLRALPLQALKTPRWRPPGYVLLEEGHPTGNGPDNIPHPQRIRTILSLVLMTITELSKVLTTILPALRVQARMTMTPKMTRG